MNNNKRPLAAIYNSISISESKKDSEKILEIVTKNTNEEILDFLGLKSNEKLLLGTTGDKIKELVNIFGSIENAKTQGINELNNLRESLKSVFSNRIMNKEGISIPFYRILNKLKHGCQIIPSKEENTIYVLVNVIKEEKDKTEVDTLAVPYSKENAMFFSKQIRIMEQTIEHLLMLYSFNL